ncbi:prolactin receptor [Dissostichus eleginoides]|uniref:Prolactin receptor n=1 Tax=Dissostichus eleginoides TaxID=100907 RepID=A0AAD9FFJ0_DISEL|nr:prolactin receptor [Dissostichus eleginoides]
MLSTSRTLALCQLWGRCAISRRDDDNSRGGKPGGVLEEGKEDSRKRKSSDTSLKCLRAPQSCRCQE